LMLKETVSRFAKEVIGPKVREMDEKGVLDKDVLRQCFEQGFMGIETSPELGGGGMSFMSSVIVIEELAKVDASFSVVVDVQNTLVEIPIRKWGKKDQKERYLPKLSTEVLGSFCLSEWGSGSDAFALKTIAKREGNKFVLNGPKAWITNSAEAGLFIVFANADPSKGYKGITAFVVERDNPGLKVGKKEDKLGIRASSTCEINFNNCVVDEKDVLGEVGQGYKIAIETLNEGRIGIAAQMIGIAKGAFENTIPYLIQRKQFGQSIAMFQGMQFEYATCASEIEAASLLVYNAARLQEEKKPFVKEAAIAKYFSSLLAERVSSKCINMLGGVGYTKDFLIEKYYRDSKIGQIYEGTNNIHLQTIANLILKDYGVK